MARVGARRRMARLAMAGACASSVALVPARGHDLPRGDDAAAATPGSPVAPATAAGATAVQNTASPLGRVGPVRVPLEVSLRVNDAFLGTISVAVDPKGAGEIDAIRFLALIRPVVAADLYAAMEARVAGRPRVDFVELNIDTFVLRFDSLALEVVGTLAPSATAATALRFAPQQEVPVPSSFDQPARFAAGVNIGAGQRYVYGRGFERVRADFNGIASIGGFEGVTLTGGATYDGERWLRRELRATHDEFERAIRFTAGEFTPSSTSFQGSARILGFGVERAYQTIRPFQNTRPIGRQQFTLDRESSVDVLVNQVRVQTVRLAAGRYDIGDFPFAAGPNQVQLVVEDIGGKREILDFDVFNSTSLLTPGLSEFGGAVGVREHGTLRYGASPAATGYGYFGLSDNLTLGANAQATTRRAQIGGVAVLGTPIGFFQIETAASRRFAAGGIETAASLDYRGEFTTRSKNDLRLALSAVYRSAEFQNAFSRDGRNSRALDVAAQVQWLAPYAISIGGSVGYSKARDGGPNSYRIDMTLGRSFGRLGLSATGSRLVFGNGFGNDTRVALGLSLRFGRRDNLFARYDSGTGRSEVEVSRTPDGRLGEISGNLRYTQDDDARAISGRLAYINNRFDLVLNHNRLERRGPDGQTANASDWNARTFIGFADGRFGIGRAADEGFVIAALHPSLRGAQASILAGDRVVARSGWLGPALVPVGRAYGAGRYEVKVDPLPIGYDLGAGTINVFPGFGSGYRAMIGSDESHIAVGILVGPAGPLALASGTIEPLDAARRKTWKPRGIFTNRSGRFVADRLAPGRYRLTLPGQADATFEIAKDAEGLIDVGTIRLAR